MRVPASNVVSPAPERDVAHGHEGVASPLLTHDHDRLAGQGRSAHHQRDQRVRELDARERDCSDGSVVVVVGTGAEYRYSYLAKVWRTSASKCRLLVYSVRRDGPDLL